MFKRISRLLNRSGSEPEDQRSLHLAFIVAALIILTVSAPLALGAVSPAEFFGFIGLLLISLFFTYQGQLWPARVITPLGGFLLITRLVYASGVHDEAIGGYYFILIIAGLLLGQRALNIFGAMSALAVLIIGYAETNGLITTRFGGLTEPITVITTAFLLLATTFGLNYMVLRLNRAVQAAHINEAAQVQANLELRALEEELEQRISDRTAELDASNQKLLEQLDHIKTLQARLRQEAIHDSLTGLFNRRYLDEVLPIELARSKRAGLPLTIFMLDIDHFKQVNDTHGHQVGDAVMKSVGESLKKSVRVGDVVCRYGGEEFLLVMSGMKEVDAHVRGEVLRTMVKLQKVDGKDGPLNVTISIGGAIYPENGLMCDELLASADDALYRAKQNGRNRVEFAERKDA